jgi:hypothetical protein
MAVVLDGCYCNFGVVWPDTPFKGPLDSALTPSISSAYDISGVEQPFFTLCRQHQFRINVCIFNPSHLHIESLLENGTML